MIDRAPELDIPSQYLLEDELRQRICSAVDNRNAEDPRLVCLTGILTASYGLKKVASGRDRRTLMREARA